MDAKQIFFERYNGLQEYPVNVLRGLSEQQQRQSPHPSLNPISWILWHVGRCEDIGVNRLLCDNPQVFDDGGWSARLRVATREMGTGMTRSQVTQLCDTVSLPALGAYRAAVAERTRVAIGEFPLAELMGELSRDLLEQVFINEGAGGTAAESIVEAYNGHTKGWLLGHIALTHSYYHIGQAFSVRTMLGLANPW
jgi:hypothetical protein